MALFRKKETYNEQMLREAGLDRVVFNTPQPAPSDPFPLDTGKIPILMYGDPHGLTKVDSGPMAWDVVTTAKVPGLAGNEVAFTTLPNGDLIVSEETGDSNLSPFADAIEERLDPPYAAAASRQ